MFVKKWTLEYWKEIKTYLPTYQWDKSDICDSCDSSDSSDKKFETKILQLKFCD